ncbi:MAG: bifunctional adenosylcobinamide kinase/adenosylcobinamide-phosphate guanylyltransferase [Thermodesulfobacteriota bacterium]
MEKIIFVVGGCRSGKSGHALTLAEQYGSNRVFLATCIPADEEMRDRVAAHRRDRGTGWETIESPYDLAEAVREHSRKADVLLVDCLTLWVSNRMLETESLGDMTSACEDLIQSLAEAACPVLLVSNEVGSGIVPDNKLARDFRDQVGWVNQKIATAADRVIWMVAGIPVTVKAGKEICRR